MQASTTRQPQRPTHLSDHAEVCLEASASEGLIELIDNGTVAFSFQIARGSAQLYPPEPAPWMDVLLESFPDLVDSKMVALVERGAPRDFRDIYAVCDAGLTTPVECWQWWRERQRRSDSDLGADRARLAVETHLARIVQHRPLAEIDDAVQRSVAERVRIWFSSELFNALVD